MTTDHLDGLLDRLPGNLLGTWGNDQTGLRLVDLGNDTAGIVIVRAGKPRDLGTISKDAEHVVWNRDGDEEPTHYRNQWLSMIYPALARWRAAS
ncbi:hypothetical protein [Glycomyces buryatensis]|uniref:Uncharacterized protein n=1 Tax=Glycomyces buryatensis TaxID=2570927 RepID=A0A4S8QJL1_9ACTN|nr:hypothetical protein [Glycomyces buryatensis]THV43462.1 hypothetical protein FAB82_00965 [Glycomyces buryatensis]